jgi:hypothetical protein
MRTAPGRSLGDLDFVRRRMTVEKLAIRGQPRHPSLFDMLQGVGQRHFPTPVMVTVGLAAHRNVDQFWMSPAVVKPGQEPLTKQSPVAQQRLARDRARD